MVDVERCPRTQKPKHLCCTGHPWRDNQAIDYGEPVPQLVIMLARAHNLDPHELLDRVEDRGWETHDKGFHEQVQIEADRMKRAR